jgi:hypothetical protein
MPRFAGHPQNGRRKNAGPAAAAFRGVDSNIDDDN